MRHTTSRNGSIRSFLLVLAGLSVPLWVIGAIYRVQVFPGFYLFQLPLAMPAVAALVLVARTRGTDGIIALLRRTADFARFKPKAWYVVIFVMFPSIGIANYWITRLSGAPVPALRFSVFALLVYCPVFLMTYFEELGLTGYATDRLLERHSILATGIIVGAIWAGYHIPGFVISGYYAPGWIIWHAIYTIVARVLLVWLYTNSGKSLFSMALCHWCFGIFWILLPPTGNLQKASPVYDPRISALIAVAYASIVLCLWTCQTHFRMNRA